jgi:hypothetical protein
MPESVWIGDIQGLFLAVPAIFQAVEIRSDFRVDER